MSPEDMQRFEVEAHEFRSVHGLTLTHTDCPDRWTAILDSPLTLAELVQRAGEHTEVCR